MENIYKHLLENGIEIRCNSHVEKSSAKAKGLCCRYAARAKLNVLI